MAGGDLYILKNEWELQNVKIRNWIQLSDISDSEEY